MRATHTGRWIYNWKSQRALLLMQNQTIETKMGIGQESTTQHRQRLMEHARQIYLGCTRTLPARCSSPVTTNRMKPDSPHHTVFPVCSAGTLSGWQVPLLACLYRTQCGMLTTAYPSLRAVWHATEFQVHPSGVCPRNVVSESTYVTAAAGLAEAHHRTERLHLETCVR